MGFRRKKEDVTTEHRWKGFVASHAALLRAVGLPEWVSDNHEYWQDVIHYGYPEQYQGGGPSSVPKFDLSGAKPHELTGFVRLLELYFGSGFAYYAPDFLKWRDQVSYDRIAERFGPPTNDPVGGV